MRLILLNIFLLFSLVLRAQSYSVLPELGFEFSSMCGIVATDSCYYTLGSVWSNENPQNYLFVSKMTFEGELIDITLPFYQERPLLPWDDLLLINQNGNLVFCGQAPNPETLSMNAFMMEITPEFDIVWFSEFENPYFPEANFIRPLGIMQDSDGNYLMGSNVSTGVENEGAQTLVIKADSEGGIIWTKEFGSTFNQDGVYDIVEIGDHYLICGFKSNEQFVPVNITFGGVLKQIDKNSGEFINDIDLESTYPIYSIDEVRVINDLVIAVGNTAYEEVFGPVNNTVTYHPYVCCFDLDENMLWEFEAIQGAPIVDCRWSNIEITSNEEILIAGIRVPFGEEFGPTSPIFGGFVAKLNLEGQLLWSNLFFHPMVTDNNVWNYTYDLTWNEEGGMTGVGFVRDVTNLWQRSWMYNVDMDGCVESDCPTNVTELDLINPLKLQVYPNPTTSVANVLIELTQHTRGSFRLTSTLGKEIWTGDQILLQPGMNQQTMNLPPGIKGTYILSWMDEHGRSESIPVIIQ